jgi:hypothetical protein
MHMRRGAILKVLLIVFTVIVVITLALGVWAALSWRTWLAIGLQNASASMVQQSGLAPQQQQAVMQRVQTLAADFKAGKLTIEQMQRITEEIAKGPLLPAGVAWGLQERYVAVSLLNDQEKAEANLHLQRLARGVWEKKLTMDAFDYVVAEVSEKQPNGSMRPKAELKLEELKGLVRRAKEQADAAGVPMEPFTMDAAAELDRAIAAAKK